MATSKKKEEGTCCRQARRERNSRLCECVQRTISPRKNAPRTGGELFLPGSFFSLSLRFARLGNPVPASFFPLVLEKKKKKRHLSSARPPPHIHQDMTSGWPQRKGVSSSFFFKHPSSRGGEGLDSARERERRERNV